MITYTVKVNADTTRWYLNGQYHRTDGPAIEYAWGPKYWYLNGQLHREDGPAIEYPDGSKWWYLNDNELTETEFNERMNLAKELTVAEIESLLGYTIKVVK
jgi:hypothetical protein